MENMVKGNVYLREDVEKQGFTLYRELSSHVLIYKKDGVTYYFDKLKFEDEGKLKLLSIS